MAVIRSKYSLYEEKTLSFHYLAVPQDKMLFYYATSAGRECLRSDYYVEREKINIYMINYVLRGEGILRVDGKEYRLHAGDLTFLHLAERSVFFPAEDGLEIIYFHVLGAQTQDIYSAFLEKHAQDYVLRNFPEKTVTDCFNAYVAEIGVQDGFYKQSRILYFLLTEILRVRRSETVQKYPKLIDNIMCWILYKCPLPTPAEVSAHFGYNSVYLERLFKHYVGESMRSYILRQKYAFACRFLADTDLSVEQIAQKVGYSDTKGLIVLFSKFGGLTPLAYRKRVRGK